MIRSKDQIKERFDYPTTASAVFPLVSKLRSICQFWDLCDLQGFNTVAHKL